MLEVESWSNYLIKSTHCLLGERKQGESRYDKRYSSNYFKNKKSYSSNYFKNTCIYQIKIITKIKDIFLLFYTCELASLIIGLPDPSNSIN